MTSLLSNGSATVRYATLASNRRRDVVTHVLERDFRGAAATISRSLSESGRIGLVTSGPPAKMCSPGRRSWLVHSRLLASWRSKASLTESISGTSRQSDSLVDLRTRPTPRAAVGDRERDVHLFGLQIDILDARASSSPLPTPVPAERGYIQTESSALATPPHCCDQDFRVEAKGLEPSILLTAR